MYRYMYILWKKLVRDQDPSIAFDAWKIIYIMYEKKKIYMFVC